MVVPIISRTDRKRTVPGFVPTDPRHQITIRAQQDPSHPFADVAVPERHGLKSGMNLGSFPPPLGGNADERRVIMPSRYHLFPLWVGQLIVARFCTGKGPPVHIRPMIAFPRTSLTNSRT